jgi:hypothetical protein
VSDEQTGSTGEPKAARVMMNPHLLEPKYKKFLSPQFAGGKVYAPFVGRPTRAVFRRASVAETYAQRIHARWCRLYDAAILAMSESVERAR